MSELLLIDDDQELCEVPAGIIMLFEQRQASSGKLQVKAKRFWLVACS